MAEKTYRLTAASYDQPQVDPDEWVAQGRPAGAYPVKTYRAGDVIEPRTDGERDRLLSLGVLEEVEEDAQSSEDAEREIEVRRQELDQEQQSLAPKRKSSKG